MLWEEKISRFLYLLYVSILTLLIFLLRSEEIRWIAPAIPSSGLLQWVLVRVPSQSALEQYIIVIVAQKQRLRRSRPGMPKWSQNIVFRIANKKVLTVRSPPNREIGILIFTDGDDNSGEMVITLIIPVLPRKFHQFLRWRWRTQSNSLFTKVPESDVYLRIDCQTKGQPTEYELVCYDDEGLTLYIFHRFWTQSCPITFHVGAESLRSAE